MPQLDGLRAIAISLVFFHHWTILGNGLGIVGVQLFFVLSGFLITRILLKQRRAIEEGRQSVGFSMRRFYARRFLRILPLYYLCLAFFLMLNRFDISRTWLWHGLYLSNVLFFRQGAFQGPFSHFWSLAVEEQFYLFWPCMVLLLPGSWLTSTITALICFGPLTRIITSLAGYTGFVHANTMVWANFDTLGLGALAACYLSKSQGHWRPPWVWLKWTAPLAALLIIVGRLTPRVEVWFWIDPISVGLVSVWVVWMATRGFTGVAGALLSHPFLIYMGKISYGLYVWHMFAPAFVRNMVRLVGLPSDYTVGVIGFLLMFSWTMGIASLTWFAFEKPINSLRRHFPYQMHSSPDAGSKRTAFAR